MSNFKEKAKNSFFRGEYESALFNFSLALKEYPNDHEAKIGALLSDMATENEDEAVALFEYYEVSKDEDEEYANSIVENIIESVDFSDDIIDSFLKSSSIEEKIIAFEHCINYDDFILSINKRGSFKRAYQDIMFSTKIVIHKKEHFIDFIEKLIENNFHNMAMSYMETALMLFPHDEQLHTIANKIKK